MPEVYREEDPMARGMCEESMSEVKKLGEWIELWEKEGCGHLIVNAPYGQDISFGSFLELIDVEEERLKKKGEETVII